MSLGEKQNKKERKTSHHEPLYAMEWTLALARLPTQILDRPLDKVGAYAAHQIFPVLSSFRHMIGFHFLASLALVRSGNYLWLVGVGSSGICHFGAAALNC